MATQLDRLALCIHRPASGRPDLRSALGGLELPPQSIAVSAARFLAAGRVSLADVRSMSKYQPEDDMRALLEAHRRRDLIVPVEGPGEVFTPSDELRAGAAVVLTVQAEEAERLWSGSPGLASLREHAEAHVAVAVESLLMLDAFRRQASVHHTLPDTDGGQLLGFITELRYLRSDIHADCLAAEGLSGPSARTLHRLWRGFGSNEAVDPSLAERGLVAAGPDWPVATETGVNVCERVEQASNSEFAHVLRGVDDKRSDALLAGMRMLPGEDPRPEEDR